MRIAMVSMSASPLAAPGRADGRSAGHRGGSPVAGPGRPGPRGRGAHPSGRGGAARPGPSRAGCDGPPCGRWAAPPDGPRRPRAVHATLRQRTGPDGGCPAPPDVAHAHHWDSGVPAAEAAAAASVPVALHVPCRSVSPERGPDVRRRAGAVRCRAQPRGTAGSGHRRVPGPRCSALIDRGTPPERVAVGAPRRGHHPLPARRADGAAGRPAPPAAVPGRD